MLLKEIQQGENKKLEFKERMPSGEAIQDNFTAIVFERKINKIMTGNAEKPPKKCRKTAEKVPKNVVLSHQEEKIILFVKENLKIDVKSVENLLGVKERRAREILSGLVKKGILDKKGKTKGSYYILKE